MIKLLRADISRMFKSKCFWVCLILNFTLSLSNCVVLPDPSGQENTANALLGGGTNTVVFVAIFAALFLGTDYSNNTIRNKLTVGSSRITVYFSSLLTVIVGASIIQLAEDIPQIAVVLFGKSFGMSFGEFAFKWLILLLAIVATSAILTLLGMLITSKSANVAIAITAVFALTLGALIIMELLAQPEYESGFELTENGVVVTEPQKNPVYIGPGLKRDILTAANDVLPTGQIAQIETGKLHNKEYLPFYSLGVIVITTAAGIAVFRKKDLK